MRSRSTAAALILAAVLIAAPAAAQAAFTTSTGTTVAVSAAVLAPQNGAVTGSCVLRNGHNMITVAVDLALANPRATSHYLRVSSPDGKVRYAGEVSDLPETTFRVPGNEDAMAGTWAYQIRDAYTPPGTANTWNGPAVTGTFVCPDQP